MTSFRTRLTPGGQSQLVTAVGAGVDKHTSQRLVRANHWKRDERTTKRRDFSHQLEVAQISSVQSQSN